MCMSEVNWLGVAAYAVVITVVVFLFVGFSGESSDVEDSFSSVNTSSYEPVNRSFDVRVSSGGISPSVIEVREGDTVWLRIRSVDGQDYLLFEPHHDLTAVVRFGELTTRAFVAERGEHRFFNVRSGSGNTEMKIIVT